MLQKFVSKVKGKIKKLITPTAQYKGFPYVYARYYYWKMTGKHLCYSCPKNINEKLFWLNRYWQHPLIVQCCDKIEVRKYVASCNLSHILNPIYATYDSELDIDFEKLPDSFVLKTNNNGASWFVIICHDKNVADLEQMRINMRNALNAKRPGILVADFQYQYIKPQIIAEKLIKSSNNDGKIEIQFFCFNGKVKHILVRNDLGDKSKDSFAISYNLNWERVKERKDEDLSISIKKPKHLNEMIEIAENLAKPFPHVRVDLYYVDETILFGELTFTTSGKILYNYTEETLINWGNDLVLPKKLKTKWHKYYPIYQ